MTSHYLHQWGFNKLTHICFTKPHWVSLMTDGWGMSFNSLRPRPNRRHFADDIFKCIFENENEWISHRISLKFVPKVRINNIPALVQIMAWRRPGDKPLSEPMMLSLLTHICVTRPQWVKIVLRWMSPDLSGDESLLVRGRLVRHYWFAADKSLPELILTQIHVAISITMS